MEEFNSKTNGCIEDLQGFNDSLEFLRGYLDYKNIEFQDIFKAQNKKNQVYTKIFEEIKEKYVTKLKQKLLKRENVFNN